MNKPKLTAKGIETLKRYGVLHEIDLSDAVPPLPFPHNIKAPFPSGVLKDLVSVQPMTTPTLIDTEEKLLEKFGQPISDESKAMTVKAAMEQWHGLVQKQTQLEADLAKILPVLAGKIAKHLGPQEGSVTIQAFGCHTHPKTGDVQVTAGFSMSTGGPNADAQFITAQMDPDITAPFVGITPEFDEYTFDLADYQKPPRTLKVKYSVDTPEELAKLKLTDEEKTELFAQAYSGKKADYGPEINAKIAHELFFSAVASEIVKFHKPQDDIITIMEVDVPLLTATETSTTLDGKKTTKSGYPVIVDYTAEKANLINKAHIWIKASIAKPFVACIVTGPWTFKMKDYWKPYKPKVKPGGSLKGKLKKLKQSKFIEKLKQKYATTKIDPTLYGKGMIPSDMLKGHKGETHLSTPLYMSANATPTSTAMTEIINSVVLQGHPPGSYVSSYAFDADDSDKVVVDVIIGDGEAHILQTWSLDYILEVAKADEKAKSKPIHKENWHE